MSDAPLRVHRYTVWVDMEPTADGWDASGEIVTSYIAPTPQDALAQLQKIIKHPANIAEVRIRRHD